MNKFVSINRLAVLLLCLLSLASCLNIALNSLGVLEKNATLKFISNGEKRIVFIPMHHIGKKEFYDDVEKKIDSLSKNGFIIFYEGVRLGQVKDSLQKDTLFKKIRKIVGLDLVALNKNQGYLDVENNRIMGREFKSLPKYQLVNQPKKFIIMSDTTRFKSRDGNYVQLVAACEQKFGPVILSEYDLLTKSGEKYKTEVNKDLKNYFVLEFRNKLLADAIIQESNNNIVILYGAKHFEGLLEVLKTLDKNFREVERF